MPDIIDRIIEHEGGSKMTNDPADSGGRTQYGISEKANPAAWADGVVTYEEARALYRQKYILAEKFDTIPDPYLREQVIDFGVTAGPDTAARKLQEVVGVKVDGEIGPQTLAAIAAYPSQKLFGYPIPGHVAVNLAFERARAAYYVRITQQGPKNLKWLFGWLRRTVDLRHKDRA